MLVSSIDLQINELCSFCKFVASFPGVLTVSRTQICFKNLGEKVQLLCLCSQFFFPLLSCTSQCTLESLLSPGSCPMTIKLFFLLTEWVTFPPYPWIKSAVSSLLILSKIPEITNVSPSKQFSTSWKLNYQVHA